MSGGIFGYGIVIYVAPRGLAGDPDLGILKEHRRLGIPQPIVERGEPGLARRGGRPISRVRRIVTRHRDHGLVPDHRLGRVSGDPPGDSAAVHGSRGESGQLLRLPDANGAHCTRFSAAPAVLACRVNGRRNCISFCASQSAAVMPTLLPDRTRCQRGSPWRQACSDPPVAAARLSRARR
jgi:hypothetical protein